MLIVDDHLALLAITGRLPDLGVDGPVVTTRGFHFRLARAPVRCSSCGTALTSAALSRTRCAAGYPLREHQAVRIRHAGGVDTITPVNYS